MPSITSALVLPFGVAFASRPFGRVWQVLLLAPASFLAGAQFGPTYSAVQTLAAPQTRALAAAGVTAMNTILGLGLAPPLVGLLNDLGAASYGNESIRYSLALMMASHLAASWLLLRSSKTLKQNLRRTRAVHDGGSYEVQPCPFDVRPESLPAARAEPRRKRAGIRSAYPTAVRGRLRPASPTARLTATKPPSPPMPRTPPAPLTAAPKWNPIAGGDPTRPFWIPSW